MLLDRTILPEALTSVEAARDFLKIEDAEHDPTLIVFINGITTAIEAYCCRGLKSIAEVQYLSGTGTNTINPTRWPVTTLTSATYLTGDYSTTEALDIAGWRCDDAGRLFLPNDRFYRGFQNIALTGVFGYLAGTHDRDLMLLETACQLWLRRAWQGFTNQTGAVDSVGAGSASAQFKEGAGVPDDVKVLLRKYVDKSS